MDFLIGTLIGGFLRDSKAKPPMWLGGYRWRSHRKRMGLFVVLAALMLLLIGAAFGGFLLGGPSGAIGGPVGAIIVLIVYALLFRSPA
jgi:hypothetical protein